MAKTAGLAKAIGKTPKGTKRLQTRASAAKPSPTKKAISKAISKRK